MPVRRGLTDSEAAQRGILDHAALGVGVGQEPTDGRFGIWCGEDPFRQHPLAIDVFTVEVGEVISGVPVDANAGLVGTEPDVDVGEGGARPARTAGRQSESSTVVTDGRPIGSVPVWAVPMAEGDGRWARGNYRHG